MFETQIKAGLLPKDAKFDMSKYVADRYLKRARATSNSIQVNSGVAQPQYRPLAPMMTTSRPSGRLTAMI